MLVTIVAIANADNSGLDLDRLEKVEDLPEEVARTMLQIGTAREPSDEELGAYKKAQAKDADADAENNGGELPSGQTQARSGTGQAEDGAAPERPLRAKKATPPAEPQADSTPTDAP